MINQLMNYLASAMDDPDGYLAHHGIKGQQWGVEHGPPYPVQWGSGNVRTTLKKGTELKRLTIKDESESTGHAYANYLKGDVHHYEGFFGARLKALNKGAKVEQVTLKAAKDMVSPSENERVQAFVDLYRSDPMIGKKMGDYYKHDTIDAKLGTLLPKKYLEYKFSNLSDEDLTGSKSKGFHTFTRAMGDEDPYIREAYMTKLKDAGYDFMSDQQDKGRYAVDPVIVFNREESTEYGGQKEITTGQILKTWAKEGNKISGKDSARIELQKAEQMKKIKESQQ